MNINRHNYEEFFLLYVDNELTAGQRKIVEAFVASNPDLKEEFELIQQSTFTNDVKLDETFINSLLKPVDEETTISEEQLLLYVDDELKAEEKAQVEKELVANTSLQKELQWLRRSQLTADASIVFPDKSLLYKQAEPARVFSLSMTARRWSAAAAVALLLGTSTWLMVDKKANQQGSQAGITKTTKTRTNVPTNAPTTVKDVVEQTLKQQKQEFESSTASSSASVNQQQPTTNKNTSVASNNTIETTTNNPAVETPIEITKTDVPEKINVEKVTVPSNNPTTSTVQPIANNISYASYNNDVADEEDDVLLTEERQRKSGIAGFLKKAKRTLERKTGIQSSSSEVRFAVFAVNTQ